MNDKEALKLALEALEGYESCIDTYYAEAVCPQIDKAITAIKEALSSPNGEAQPEQEQGPIGFYSGRLNGHDLLSLVIQIPVGTNLYTTPPQRTWVGLTDEEIWQTVTDCTIGGDLHADKFARAIEAKLKEKNTNA